MCTVELMTADATALHRPYTCHCDDSYTGSTTCTKEDVLLGRWTGEDAALDDVESGAPWGTMVCVTLLLVIVVVSRFWQCAKTTV